MKLLSLSVPVIAIALAVTALAVVPGVLTTLSPGSGGSPLASSGLAWKVGDTWTYNLSLGADGTDSVIPQEMRVQWSGNESHVFGTLRETVVGNVSTEGGAAWNVTETLTVFVGRDGAGNAENPTPSMPHGNVTGYVWYRQSDLAPLYARKSVHLVRTWNMTGTEDPWSFGHPILTGTYTLTYDAGTEVRFHPGLSVFRFPLTENTTYNVTSNATIHTWTSFLVSGPNVTVGSDRFSTITVPIGLVIRTGHFENVTTPAGTFNALPVSAYRKPMVGRSWDPDTGAVANLTLETDCMPTVHALATGWFSSQVGNVIKADVSLGGFGGPRVELILVSYGTG